MLDRNGYLPGVPCWIDLSPHDPEAAVTFYSSLFGWDFTDVMPAEADGHYFVGRLRGGDVAAVGSAPPDGPPSPAWMTYIWVQSANETAAIVRDAGGRVLAEPFDVMTAGRMAVCSDPEGAVFCLWQAGEHRGAQIVNEPGALSFNGLHTRDAAAAEAFYGEVFGWERLGLDGGVQMWRLGGYGDFLAESDPELRDRMAQTDGAPAGFEDVVASLAPIPDGQPDVSAHWSVTFAIDDPDAIAETVVALGGTVLIAPFDAPWVRMAVIADPQGATFTASKYVPENRNVVGEAA